jgi:hypothetical protein
VAGITQEGRSCEGVFTLPLRNGPSETRRVEGFTGSDWAVLKTSVIYTLRRRAHHERRESPTADAGRDLRTGVH